MTWADLPESASPLDGEHATSEPSDELVNAFEGHARRRLALLGVVFGGGLSVIVLMRLVLGGPAQVQADPAAEQIVAGFLEPGEGGETPMVTTFEYVSIFGQGDATSRQVPWSQLSGNPFVLPGGDSPIVHRTMPAQSVNSARRARETQMRQQVEAMRVSMVLRGRHTMAIVGDITLPLNEPVELDPGTTLTLTSIDASGVHVVVTDVALEAHVEVILDRP